MLGRPATPPLHPPSWQTSSKAPLVPEPSPSSTLQSLLEGQLVWGLLEVGGSVGWEEEGGGVRKWSFGGGGVVGEPVGYGYVEGSMSGLRFDWRSQL